MKTMYLAGGARGTKWQREVKALFPDWVLFDPRKCKSKDPATYTRWDLNHIDKARVVLAYMDSDNPSGYGLSFEVGYASAQDKVVVFVDAMRRNDPRRKYFDMIRVRANVVCSTLKEVAFWLKDQA